MADTFTGTATIPVVIATDVYVTEGGKGSPGIVVMPRPFIFDVIYTAVQTAPDVAEVTWGEKAHPFEHAEYEVREVWLEGHEDHDNIDKNYTPQIFQQWLIEHLQGQQDMLHEAWADQNEREREGE